MKKVRYPMKTIRKTHKALLMGFLIVLFFLFINAASAKTVQFGDNTYVGTGDMTSEQNYYEASTSSTPGTETLVTATPVIIPPATAILINEQPETREMNIIIREESTATELVIQVVLLVGAVVGLITAIVKLLDRKAKQKRWNKEKRKG